MQRTRVRIQPSATFIEQLITVNCLGKTKNKEKEAGNRPFKKKKFRVRRETTKSTYSEIIHMNSNSQS